MFNFLGRLAAGHPRIICATWLIAGVALSLLAPRWEHMARDGQCALVQVSLGTPYLAVQTRASVDRAEQVVRARLAKAGASAPDLYVTGPAGVGRDLTSAGASSLEQTTLATVLLVIVILLLVHRAPLLALVPLVTIAMSVWVALKMLALFTLIPGFYLVNISQVFA